MTFLIYLISVLNKFNSVLDVVSPLMGAALAVFFCWGVIAYLEGEEELLKSLKKLCRNLFVSFIFVSFLGLTIPNGSTLAAMYLIPKIVQNEDITKLNKNDLKVLVLLTEKFEKQLLDDKNNETTI